jgi:hypothetical protein
MIVRVGDIYITAFSDRDAQRNVKARLQDGTVDIPSLDPKAAHLFGAAAGKRRDAAFVQESDTLRARVGDVHTSVVPSRDRARQHEFSVRRITVAKPRATVAGECADSWGVAG